MQLQPAGQRRRWQVQVQGTRVAEKCSRPMGHAAALLDLMHSCTRGHGSGSGGGAPRQDQVALLALPLTAPEEAVQEDSKSRIRTRTRTEEQQRHKQARHAARVPLGVCCLATQEHRQPEQPPAALWALRPGRGTLARGRLGCPVNPAPVTTNHQPSSTHTAERQLCIEVGCDVCGQAAKSAAQKGMVGEGGLLTSCRQAWDRTGKERSARRAAGREQDALCVLCV